MRDENISARFVFCRNKVARRRCHPANTATPPFAPQTLNTEQVKTVCAKFEVEVLEEDAVRVQARPWPAGCSCSRTLRPAILSRSSIFR